MMNERPSLQLIRSSDYAKTSSTQYDALVVVYTSSPSDLLNLKYWALVNHLLGDVSSSVMNHFEMDPSASSEVCIIYHKGAPGNRILLSPTGTLDGDTDDVRKFFSAARKAARKCKAAGIKSPLLLFPESPLENSPDYLKRDFAYFF